MAETRLDVLLRLKDKFSRELQASRSSLDKFSANAKRAGLLVSGFAAVGGLAFKQILSATEAERIGIQQLDQALRNVGTSYDAVKEKLEENIETLQRKTNFGDDAQRDALLQLISVTGSYEESILALPAVLDLAAGKGLDLESAATLVARALEGETDALSRYGIQIEEGATDTEIIAAVMAKFGGQAEAAVSPLQQMRNRLGDLAEVMGVALLPAVNKIAALIEQFTRFVMGLNPELLKWVAIIGAVAVAFASVAGPLLLFIGFLPALITGVGILGVFFGILLGPIGLVVLAIAGLITIGILIWRNWDTIKAKAIEIWGKIMDFFQTKLGMLTAIMMGPIGIGLLIIANWEKIRDTAVSVWQTISEAVKANVNSIIDSINGMIRALNGAFSFSLPDWIPGVGGKGFNLDIPEIPRLASGGIVRKPTLALVGEGGPEAIVPLSRGGSGGMNLTINLNGEVILLDNDSAIDRLAARLAPALRNQRRRGF